MLRRLSPIFFSVLAAFIYRHDLWNFPGCDQFDVLKTVHSSVSNADFIYRMAVLPWGDPDLFRPLGHLWIALSELAFHAHPLAGGLVGIGLHALAATMVFFLFLDLKFSRELAFAFAVALLCTWPGMEMVSWRHINLYLIFVIFMTWAWRRIALEQWNAKTAVILLVASLFHEMAIYATLACACYLFLVKDRKKAFVLLTPALAYFALKYGHDLFFEKRPNEWPEAPSVVTSLYRAVLLMGVGTQLLVLPESVVEYSQAICRKEWVSNAQTRFSYAVFGFGLLFTFFRWLYKRYATSELKDGKAMVGVIAMVTYGLIAFGLVYFRLDRRGWYYMSQSTYYYYLFIWLILCFTAVSLPTDWVRGWKKYTLIGVLLGQGIYSAWRIDGANLVHYETKKGNGQIIAKVYDRLEKNNLCLASVKTDLPELNALVFAHRLCDRPSEKGKRAATLQYERQGTKEMRVSDDKTSTQLITVE